MNDAVLEIEGLTVRSAEGDALVKNVGLCLKRQECLGIAGESGSGKTITAKAILHLLPQDLTASVTHLRVLGEDLLNLPEKERRIFLGKKIGFVPQNTVAYLHPLIKIKNQLTDGYHIHFQTSKKAAQERAKTLLDRVGIRDVNRVMESYPAQISGGMRQRVNIAMALMCEPQVIIADEPTTALDVTIQDQIMKLLNQLKQELGMSIILVTHDLGVIAQMCDRVAVMYAGQIVEMTDTVTLFSRPRHPYTYGLMGSLPNEETAGTTLEAIKGSPPNLAHLPEGCPFSPRCKYACDLCRRERPALTEVEPGHLARCHRLDVTASFQGLIEVPDGAGRKEDTPHG